MRGYERANRQAVHNDMEGLPGMVCVRPATTGGASRLVSALAIHKEIATTRPTGRTTEYKVSIFSWVEGRFAACYLPYEAKLGVEERGEVLSDEVLEALSLVQEISDRPGVTLSLRLEAGEAYFINDFTIMHGRDAFEDRGEPGQGRLLLRTWLAIEPEYTMHPSLKSYYDDLRSAYSEEEPLAEPEAA